MTCGGKHYKIKGKGYYFGRPIHKIFKKKIMEYLKFSEEDFNKDKELKMKQKQSKTGET